MPPPPASYSGVWQRSLRECTTSGVTVVTSSAGFRVKVTRSAMASNVAECAVDPSRSAPTGGSTGRERLLCAAARSIEQRDVQIEGEDHRTSQIDLLLVGQVPHYPPEPFGRNGHDVVQCGGASLFESVRRVEQHLTAQTLDRRGDRRDRDLRHHRSGDVSSQDQDGTRLVQPCKAGWCQLVEATPAL